MKYYCLFFLFIIFSSCEKIIPEDKKEPEQVKEIKSAEKPRESIENWEKNISFEGKKYFFNNMSFILSDFFVSKGDDRYFGNNGINITLSKDTTNITLENYLLKSHNKLKETFLKVVLSEKKSIRVNGIEAVTASFVLDRSKYLISIKSVILRYNDDIYTLTISGKRNDINTINELIINIFKSIEFN